MSDSSPPYVARLADWTDDRAAIRRVRETVFVVEQAVDPELEWDDRDATCVHVIVETPKRDAIATGRLEASGKIGRMAVLAAWRGRGVGAAVLDRLLAEAERRGIRDLYLHAQTHALDFYARHGFEAEGDEFDEAGIPHRLMRRRTARD